MGLRLFSSFFIYAILFWVMESASTTINLGNESDRLALLAFKDRITQDPFRILSSWNNSLHFCQWIGITCNSPSIQRVTILNLESQNLAGSISPCIANLTFLTGINLRHNNFHGEIPPEIGYLSRLQHLNLTFNSLEGTIPANLTHCSDLRILELGFNYLVGQIPDQLSSLSKLEKLGFGRNNLSGIIPPWIGNFSSLLWLSLAVNNLQAQIPDELGRLSGLRIFQVYGNKLSGMIPSSIYNLSSIYYFSVTQNQLHGIIPGDVGFTLPNLQVFAGAVNNFKGPIPDSLSNASALEVLDFSQNFLTGSVPLSIGSLKSLTRLNFEQNQLGTGETGDLNFLTVLANCTSLQVLSFGSNRLGGEFPDSVANLSTQLIIFVMGSNLIYGSIPVGIENLLNLTLLGMEGNLLTGGVPAVIGKLQNLQGLYLNVNRFSGVIPSSIGNLTMLISLFMEENRLEGSIPSSLGNCRNLIKVNFSMNNLNGSIPKQVIGLSSLSISFSAAHNSLTGSLPLEVGNLKHLAELHLSDNKLSGEIPSTLGGCLSLERLLLNGNFFQGTIPESLHTLRGIQEIDLSRNNFSGIIPEYLGNFSFLKNLNLSFNNLEGKVPKDGIFANASAFSFLGNHKLCGGVPKLGLPECSVHAHDTSGRFLAPRIIIPIAIVILFIVLMSCIFVVLYRVRNSRNETCARSSSQDWQSSISYSQLFKSTNGFSEENLLGSGSFGCVYKGVLYENGATVAVKVLNLQQGGASNSFTAECEALRNIRHRNLVRILSACSGIEHKGNDFKAIVLEFMPNGNLDQWLHPEVDYGKNQFKSLNLVQRLNIAIDVASAVEYLHHHCHVPIVHCDLKPSNVLLDGDLTAHVSDFGLARFILESSDNPSKDQTISVRLKGSIGYIPPEYGMSNQVSTFGDVYSYGILLLEIFIGKRPTDDMFKDGQSLHKLAAMAFPERIMEIVDPPLLLVKEVEEEDKLQQKDGEIEEVAILKNENFQSDASTIQECLASVIRIGLSCSRPSPRDRMVMTTVVNKLHAIRDSFLMLNR